MADNISVISSDLLGVSYEKIKHKSGTEIYLWQMPEFTTVESYFVTKYGSNYQTFKTKNTEDFITVPEGIAHYLEHKLFENEDSDAMNLFAKTGASCNAFTSKDITAYYFSCNSRFEENLEILLKFVQNPYFTDELVEKERGIISEEINMCDDSPIRLEMKNLYKAMYANHPIKEDIAGTIESIQKINADLLYKCYNTFYNLNNMALFIAGNFDRDKALEICDKFLKPSEDLQIEVKLPNEPREVCQKEVVAYMPIKLPLFMIGIKLEPKDGRTEAERSIIADLAISTVLGNASEFYEQMQKEGLLTCPVGGQASSGKGYSNLVIYGESKDAKAVSQKIIECFEKAKTEINGELFDINKKRVYASALTASNAVSGCVGMMLNSFCNDINAFELLEIVSKVTSEQVKQFIQDNFKEECISFSYILPQEKQ